MEKEKIFSKEEIIFLNQLIKSLEETELKLEEYYEKEDVDNFNGAKKMILNIQKDFRGCRMTENLKEIIQKEKSIVKEINYLLGVLNRTNDAEEKRMILSQIKSLKTSLRNVNEGIEGILGKKSLLKPLTPPTIKDLPEKEEILKSHIKVQLKEEIEEVGDSGLEQVTLKRLKKGREEIAEKKTKKPHFYVKTASRLFTNTSRSLIDKGLFKDIKRDLLRTNLQFVPTSYISVILLTTILSIFLGLFFFVFFLFFNFGPALPIITKVTESLGQRFLKVFWILFAVPIGAFLIVYFYPSLEKKSIENKINRELPFATINMSAIAGSMIEPSKVFRIIILTKEYPYLGKEFTKLINQINVQGYNLVSALRNRAFNSPSKKLSELFNGLATTINSGGDLRSFFDKRAESLLFEYRIGREKHTRSAETFMDIYISVVIAAPMMLMLLLMMMKISGLGISISSFMISLIMVLGVSLINVVFLSFLHLKQPEE